MPAVARSGRASLAALAGLLGAAALGGLTWAGVAVDRELDAPRDLHAVDHATSGECQRCHPSHFESWSRTFHRTMTQTAHETSVLGDFDGARFRYGGIEARMTRTDDGGFEMRFDGPGGVSSSARVVRTVGSHRYQQYLARDGDVLFRLPMAWHVEEGRWFHMNGAFLTPDPPAPPPGGRVSRDDYMRHVVRWNDNCVFCHNVAPNPGWNEGGARWETETAELGVACEACHGPADAHARANANPLRRYALHLGDRADPTIVNPARLSPARSAEVCGRCHGQRITDDVSRFMAGGDPYVPGDRLADYSRPLARDTPLDGDDEAFAERFWPDGTPRLTAYEYQGLLQSACAPMTCIDCHGMHEGDPSGQIRPAAAGDAACTQCHDRMAPDHARHEEVACVDCHMPRIVYGLVDAFRSHRVERPAPTRADRPDACALCHADRPRAWVVRGWRALWPQSVTAREDAGPRRATPIAERSLRAGGPERGEASRPAAAPPERAAADGTSPASLERTPADASPASLERAPDGTSPASLERAPADASLASLERAPGGTSPTSLERAPADASSTAAPGQNCDGWPRAHCDALAGDPIERAVALAALGRTDGLRSEAHRARRLGILLDTMEADPYPALRRIAWRSARRLAPAVAVDWSGYVPTGPAAARGAWVASLRARLGDAVIAPPPGRVADLRARAERVAIEIGE
ncbi:MAG TPA: ammonia-forming cytochrome c nitrite reductase subunit c552 [Sandaracinaceae bacterium LLY-WYZ-13_1]|nr:ammonia-forming cytochrome c nitrite reductase subunit c552 [Sandaracinaceae bacterium LLY-WYZ-13_1]